MSASEQDLLTVEKLSVEIAAPGGIVRALDRVSLSLRRGRTLAVVGETGSGKSMLCRAIIGIVPRRATHTGGGRIIFEGRDLSRLPERELNRIRGREIGIVLQNPMSSLNPVLTVGRQIAEPMEHHLGLSRSRAKARAVELLEAVGIPAAEERSRWYPHQMSGGMRQRVAIAMALSCDPKLLIADEPTTALDVTVQAEILNLLGRLQKERDLAVLLVSHDLSVVAGRAQDTAVMYRGRIVEKGPTIDLFTRMRMHYTKALMDAIPRIDDPPGQTLKAIAGPPPSAVESSPGCHFAPRCVSVGEICRQAAPLLRHDLNSEHCYACWFPLERQNDREDERVAAEGELLKLAQGCER